MSKETLFDLKIVEDCAGHLLDALAPVCHRIDIAGSTRRSTPQVHDLDIVCWPIVRTIKTYDLFGEVIDQTLDISELENRLLAAGAQELNITEKIIRFTICWYEKQTIPVEIYLSEQDGSNFDALLQMRTGSEALNISLAVRAKKLNLCYVAGYGIYDLQKIERLDDGTEDGLFIALGIAPIDPVHRNGHYLHCLQQQAHV
ncbi:MAG TPA: hypothetical protein VLH56_05210 [Dissulfurispiraceae bacterium]|nr:hypothetical protein [Dissulfurispiraceae bacterium]